MKGIGKWLTSICLVFALITIWSQHYLIMFILLGLAKCLQTSTKEESCQTA